MNVTSKTNEETRKSRQTNEETRKFRQNCEETRRSRQNSCRLRLIVWQFAVYYCQLPSEGQQMTELINGSWKLVEDH